MEKNIPKISTGEDSTLETYRGIALCLSLGNTNTKAVKFFDGKIERSPNKEKEIVLAPETQMMGLILNLISEDLADGTIDVCPCCGKAVTKTGVEK